jgi:hypothetical protein
MLQFSGAAVTAMRIRHDKFGYFYIGRSFYYYADREISFGLLRRNHVSEGDIVWRLSAGCAWNWLPPIRYRHLSPAATIQGSAAAWTGREIGFAGFEWRRWFFRSWFDWIKDR